MANKQTPCVAKCENIAAIPIRIRINKYVSPYTVEKWCKTKECRQSEQS